MSKPKARLAKKKERMRRRNHERKHMFLWVTRDSVIVWLFTGQIRSVSDITETLSSIVLTNVLALVLSGTALNLILYYSHDLWWAALKPFSVFVYGWTVSFRKYVQKRYPPSPSSQPFPSLHFLLTGRVGPDECVMTPVDHNVRKEPLVILW